MAGLLRTGTIGGIRLWLPRRVNNDPSVVDDDDSTPTCFIILKLITVLSGAEDTE